MKPTHSWLSSVRSFLFQFSPVWFFVSILAGQAVVTALVMNSTPGLKLILSHLAIFVFWYLYPILVVACLSDFVRSVWPRVITVLGLGLIVVSVVVLLATRGEISMDSLLLLAMLAIHYGAVLSLSMASSALCPSISKAKIAGLIAMFFLPLGGIVWVHEWFRDVVSSSK